MIVNSSTPLPVIGKRWIQISLLSTALGVCSGFLSANIKLSASMRLFLFGSIWFASLLIILCLADPRPMRAGLAAIYGHSLFCLGVLLRLYREPVTHSIRLDTEQWIRDSIISVCAVTIVVMSIRFAVTRIMARNFPCSNSELRPTCQFCGYSLIGLGTPITCPECGNKPVISKSENTTTEQEANRSISLFKG